MDKLKKILLCIIKYLLFLPLQSIFIVLILVPAIILVLGKKISKLADNMDSEITTYLHKKFKD